MRRLFVGFGILLLLALVVLRISDPAPVQSLRLAYFDQLQKWQPRTLEDLPVRVVDIDELSLAKHGQWPWPRDKLADLITRLRSHGAAAVVFDVLFLEPDRLSPKYLLSQPAYADILKKLDPAILPDNDTIFAKAIAGNQVVLGVSSTTTSSQGNLPQKAGIVEIGDAPSLGFPLTVGISTPLPDLSAAAEGLASVNMSPYDTAERVRRVPLLWRDAEGQIIPSLALEALRVAFGEKSFLVRGLPDQTGVTESIRVGSLEIPTRSDGSIWVRFRPDHPSLYRSAHEVLTGNSETLRADFNGRIVLVGTSAAGLLDVRTTSLGENVPGVSIHAQIIEQILQGAFIFRNDSIAGIEILVFLVLGGAILWVMSASGAFYSIISSVSIGILIMTASWLLFKELGVLFDVTLPIFGGVLFFSAMTAFQFFVADREKKMIRTSFSHYVAPALVARLAKNPDQLKLGGERRELSILFTDVRGFTTISESFKEDPTGLTALMNRFLTIMSDSILDKNGTIDKYMGDAIMAFWNAPLDEKDHARLSCASALQMMVDIENLNATRSDETGGAAIPINIGIGINTGDCVVGNMGSNKRFDYSALGDPVNLASRLEGQTKSYGVDIIIGASTCALVEHEYAVIELDLIKVKGKLLPEHIYALIGDESVQKTEGFASLKAANEAMIATYRSQDWDGALKAAQQVRAAGVPLSVDLNFFASLYEERIATFQASPPPKDWDGVFVAISK